QGYTRVLRDDGLAVVMAYPWMNGHGADAARWVEGLARRAVGRARTAARARGGAAGVPAPPGAVPVLIKLQAYDWRTESWVAARSLRATEVDAVGRPGPVLPRPVPPEGAYTRLEGAVEQLDHQASGQVVDPELDIRPARDVEIDARVTRERVGSRGRQLESRR